jgi:hypothetical protein
MWLMKRAVVDGWDTDKAMEEPTALGLTSATLEAVLPGADSPA